MCIRDRNNNASFAVSVLPDKNGIVWVGTENNGLVKFNTNTQISIFQKEILPVRTLLKKSQNELWVATMGIGIGIFNTETDEMEFITKENSSSYSILSNDIYGLYLDHQNRLWVRDQSLGISVSKSSGTLFHHPILPETLKDELKSNKQFSYAKAYNKLFVSTSNKDIMVFEKNNDQYEYIETLAFPIARNWKNLVLDIFSDKKNRTWFLVKTNSSVLLFQYNFTEKSIEPYPLTDLEEIIPSQQTDGTILEDNFGAIWISFATGEFWKLENEKISKKNFGKNLPNGKNPEICKVIVDHENNFWAASLVEGVFKLDLKRKEEIHYPYRLDGGLQGWRIMSIEEIEKGKIWVGTSAAGIQEIDALQSVNQEMPIYDQNNGVPDDKINGIVKDEIGNIWLITMRGVIKYNLSLIHI